MIDVILYGLNGITNEKEQMLGGGIRIIGYSDTFANIASFRGKKFVSREELRNYTFDYILIVTNLNTARLIKDDLCKYIETEKVIIFEEIYNSKFLQKINRLEILPERTHGVILGISHAVTGINSIDGFINCAVRSQDIYYNIQAFNYIQKKLKNIDTLIIEMYDYNYLNYDVSLTRNAVPHYYSQGGIWQDEHNFKRNIHYNQSLSKEMNEKKGIGNIQCGISLSAELDNGFEAYKYTNVLDREAPLPMRKFVSGLVTNRYENTISENKRLLQQFCRKLKEHYSQNIKVIFIFVPRYISMEKALAPHMTRWKNEMYIFLKDLIDMYGVYVYDFKNEITISSNNRFYNDVNHLNYTGACAFTDMLMDCISANKRNLWSDS